MLAQEVIAVEERPMMPRRIGCDMLGLWGEVVMDRMLDREGFEVQTGCDMII